MSRDELTAVEHLSFKEASGGVVTDFLEGTN